MRSSYKNPPKENKELRKEKEALEAEMCEVPQLKTAIAGLEADNDELRAMNASLAEQLRGHHAVGKKLKKKNDERDKSRGGRSRSDGPNSSGKETRKDKGD